MNRVLVCLFSQSKFVSSTGLILTLILLLKALRFRVMPSATPHVEGSSIPEWRRGAKAAGRAYSTAQESALRQADEIPPRLPAFNGAGKNRHGNGANKLASETLQTPRHTTYQDLTSPKQVLSGRASTTSPWEQQKPSSGTTASGKRKAGIAVVPRPARRRKFEPSTELKDEAYVRRTLSLPTKEQYPLLPTGLLESPKYVFHNAVQGLMRLHSTFPLVTNTKAMCNLICDIPRRQPITALGEGVNKVGSVHDQ